jgi:S1-C subfamily serine protease
MTASIHDVTLRRILALFAAAFVGATLVAAGATGAVKARTTGVVVIETNLGYLHGQAAGTGMVISSSGIVLTNNHVIRGATTVKIVDPSSGRRYTSTVLGYSVSSDVALLKLNGSPGLSTVSLGTSGGLRTGAAVTAVGNAGGTGKLVSSSGTIQALNRTITVTTDQGGSARLQGLIQTNTELRPGDSGGALLDSNGRVIGMNTAASTGFSFRSGSHQGYAIPVDKARALAKQIQSGRSSASVHVGATAFLGILGEPARFSDAAGALVREVVSGGPAARAGLQPGDVITHVGGRSVTSTDVIAKLLLQKKPGDAIRVTWVDQVGNSTSASVRLGSGPPQ